MIEVRELCKSYGERQAIINLSFKIEKGDVCGFLGPNGAGKSTTMKIITGFMAPTSGEAKICGFDVFEDPIEVKKRIGYLPEIPPLYTEMTVQEYLKFVAEIKDVKSSRLKLLIEKALGKTQLLDVRHRLIRNLSKGFKQRVGIAQALVSDPEVLVLDEPTVGLDPKQVAEIRELIKELRGEHTIILSTHILTEVQAVCNQVIIIHEGKIVAQNSIDQIENLNQGSIVLNIRTRKPHHLEEKLRMIEGVKEVVGINQNQLRITLIEQEELIEVIARQIIESGSGLIELTPSRANLEDVFLKLTYGQNT